MRIGIDCRTLQEGQPSGVSVYTRHAVDALLQLPQMQAHTVVLFVNAYHFSAPWITELQHTWSGPQVEWRIRRVPNKVVTVGEVLCGFPSTQWMFGDVDVIWVPSMQFFPVLRAPSAPVVLTIHDVSFLRYPDCLSVKGRLWHQLLYPKRFVRRAVHLIAVSEHTARDVEQSYDVPKEKISVVYPGLHAKVDNRAATPLVEPLIVSLSTIEPRKNIHTLLDAFEQVRVTHPTARLVVAGAAGWKSTPLIQRMNAQPGVEYRGYISEQEKAVLLLEASVFVYPSLYEGFGFPPLEAQQYGVPVVAGSHSSLAEVLGDSALRVDVLDVHSVSRAINHLLNDETLRAQLVARGLENVKRFSWEQTAEGIFAILQQYARRTE